MNTICVIDRSGSMAFCLDDTLGGFNTFLADQPKESKITTFLFNNEVHKFHDNVKIEDAEHLTKTNYRPSGGTALLDAIGFAIKYANDEKDVTMVILTDGAENSSQTYTKQHVNDLIDDRKARGWNFVFLAANQDAIKTAGGIGISEGSALTFDPNNTQDAFECLTSAVSRMRKGETQDVQFSQLERTVSCPNGP